MRFGATMVGPLTAIIIAGAFGAQAQTVPESAREACRASAISLCRTEALSGDRAGVRACLIRNFSKVSPDCQAAMKAAQARAAELQTHSKPLKP